MQVSILFLVACVTTVTVLHAANPTTAQTAGDRPCTRQVLNNDYLLRFIIEMCDPCANISIYDKKALSFLNSLYPAQELETLTGHSFLKDIPQGLELRRLLLEARGSSPLFRKHMLKMGSPILPKSLFTIGCMLKDFIQDGKFTTNPFKLYCHAEVIKHLMQLEKFDELAILVRVTPNDVFLNQCCPEFPFAWIAHHLTIADPSCTMNVIVSPNYSHSDYEEFICGVLSVPMEPASLSELVQLFDYKSRVHELREAIIKLCAWKFPKLTSEKRAKLYDQNIRLLSYLDKCKQVNGDTITIRSCARILNEIRFNEASLDQDLLEETIALISTPSARKFSLANVVLTALVYSQRRFLFDEICKIHICIQTNYDLEEALLQFPEYARRLLGDIYLKNQGEFALVLAIAKWEASKNIHHNAEEIGVFYVYHQSLVLAAATCTAEEFNNLIVKRVNQGRSRHLDDAFSKLSEFLDNPVPSINIILSHLDLVEFPSVTVFREYFEALLLDERNKNASLDALLAREVFLDTECVDALINNSALATAFGSEKSRPIRERVCINLDLSFDPIYRIFVRASVLPLFKALHIPIEDWSFIVEIDRNRINSFGTELKHISWSDLANRAKESGFMSHLAIWMCKNLDITNQFYRSVESGSPNPLLLPCADVLEMWYQTNPENFLRHVPSQIREVFIC